MSLSRRHLGAKMGPLSSTCLGALGERHLLRLNGCQRVTMYVYLHWCTKFCVTVCDNATIVQRFHHETLRDFPS